MAKQTDGLSPDGAKFFRRLCREWGLVDGAAVTAAWAAAQALDRLKQAREILAAEGPMIRDRFGQPRLHPATALEREARQGLLAGLKALNLDLASAGVDDGATK